ncbi:2-oxoglutarate-dependent ethylene/succinate-forming enzyme [Podosphaera aphanis]|nr:2-oxoglutarate-dependent ethylene/succinate-forming enzyme [Podosphaera aphanis]
MSHIKIARKHFSQKVVPRAVSAGGITRVSPALSHNGLYETPFISNSKKIMPPHHKASIGHLKTFTLPTRIEGNADDHAMAKSMIDEWRQTGIFQIKIPEAQRELLRDCFKVSQQFFSAPYAEKAKLVDDQSFAGYIASGEELTDGIADYSEIFTVTKDLPISDSRVKNAWPCHGPCPWPNALFQNKISQLISHLGESGEKLLKLTALGLGLRDPDTLVKLTEDGWHHMRVLRFPHVDMTNGKGKTGRGIGSHTDYGLLVIAAQDDVGGLFVRPRIEGESIKNWQSSAAGLNETDDKWLFVPPVPDTFTVFPGDMMQHMTNDFLPSTPHKVGLNVAERKAFAYFHEPNFSSVIEPLPEFRERIHYGTHFTNMFMRNYPERITAKRINQERRMDTLDQLRQKALDA